MKKHNIGRISFLVIIVNILFLLIYFANQNPNNPNSNIEVCLNISRDESVSDSYINDLSDIISSKKYNEKELNIISSYQWYLTDNIDNTDSYSINSEEVSIYAVNKNQFDVYLNESLEEILK